MSNVGQGTEQARAATKRKAILDAANRLMLAEGLRRVTHRQVAAAAGVPVGSIGYYYSSREKLIEVCFAEFHARRVELAHERIEAAQAAGDGPRDPETVAEDILDIATAGQRDALGGLIFAIVDASREQDAEGRERVTGQFTESIDLIGELLAASGYATVPARTVAEAVLGSAIIGAQLGEDPRETAQAALLSILDPAA